MKRIIVWVDSADKDTDQTREKIKDYLSKAGLKYTIFDICELIIESEIE
jgi:hypothetical protein